MLIDDEITLTGNIRDLRSREICDADPDMNTRGDLLLSYDPPKRAVEALVFDGQNWCRTAFWPWLDVSASAATKEEADLVDFKIDFSRHYRQAGRVLVLPRVRGSDRYRLPIKRNL